MLVQSLTYRDRQPERVEGERERGREGEERVKREHLPVTSYSSVTCSGHCDGRLGLAALISLMTISSSISHLPMLRPEDNVSLAHAAA